jgi:hypothetical protein
MLSTCADNPTVQNLMHKPYCYSYVGKKKNHKEKKSQYSGNEKPNGLNSAIKLHLFILVLKPETK